MKKPIIFLLKATAFLLLVMGMAALAHAWVFPQETRSILIDYSDYEKRGNMYFSPGTPDEKKEVLQRLIDLSNERVGEFWGETTCRPKFIYCDSPEEFEKFSLIGSAPAIAVLKLDGYIVMREEGLNVDVISHEISHAELYNRIGFYNLHFKVPAWFNEGLAMQVDERNHFSEDTLREKTNNLQNLPDITNLQTGTQFQSGSPSDVQLHYLTAKYQVKNWHTKDKLDQLVGSLKQGKSFEEAYGER